MQFVHQSLTWGFLLALLPLVIHLINLVRRRRVQWAAMEFLLQSYRKHRTSIWLQQWALLLLRMAAVGLLVAMLAQWVTQREWIALFGRTATHHFVLIDDSYSMAERSSGATAFDRAEQAFANIVSQARSQETRQKITLLRWSNASVPSGSAPSASIPDLNSESIDGKFDDTLADVRRRLQVTQLATGPLAALRVVKQLLGIRQDEINVLYLLSDFREKDWSNPAELQVTLGEIADAGAQIHFVDCSLDSESNLAITELSPAEDTRAAGVPLFVDLQVHNYGKRTERKVPIQLRAHVYDPAIVTSSRPGENVSRREEPPALLIDEIRPGESVTARAQVYFPVPGDQVVEAFLPEDAVTFDNRRWCIVDLPDSELVLVVDGSQERRHSYYLTSAFAPGRQATTGIQPDQVRGPAFLRDVTDDVLNKYRAIYLLDVPRLEDRAITNLSRFVRGGGGLCFFVGENVNRAHYNERLFDEGRGLFPLPLGNQTNLPNELLENTPDLEVQDHPVFEPFFGEQNPLIRWVRIENYLEPAAGWSASTAAPTEILAELRNRDPLVAARPYGDGRIVAILTTAAPEWNNWANDPSFVVVMLKLHAYLAAPLRRSNPYTTGGTIKIVLPADRYRSDVTFVVPRGSEQGQIVIEKTATASTDGSATIDTSLSRSAGDGPTDRGGIYEAWTHAISGPTEVRRMAVNVDPQEGSLAKASAASLLESLAPLEIEFHEAGEYATAYSDNSAANRSLLLMGLLVSALLGEQLLAFLTSFHPSRRGAG